MGVLWCVRKEELPVLRGSVLCGICNRGQGIERQACCELRKGRVQVTCACCIHAEGVVTHRNIAVLVLRGDLWLWLQAHSEKAEHSKARQEDARSGDWGRRCSQTVRSLRHFFQSASAKATHPAQRRCSLSILAHPSLTLQGSRAWSPLRDGCEMPRITWHQRDSIWPPGEPQPGSDQRRGTTLFRTLKVNIGVEKLHCKSASSALARCLASKFCTVKSQVSWRSPSSPAKFSTSALAP